MWDTAVPHTSCSWEPVELRILKQELAHLACKCNTCETFKNPSLHLRGYQNDEAVQVEQKNHLLDKYIYATSDLPADGVPNDATTNMMQHFSKDIFCPNCYFIWDLLRRSTKVLKDEGSEMKPDSTDKSTEKTVNFADSATSVTNKPANDISSNLTLCDYISDSTSASSLENRNDDPSFEGAHPDKKKNNHDRVTFLDDYPSKDECKEDPPTFTIRGNCFCLENFIDTIRPPLKM